MEELTENGPPGWYRKRGDAMLMFRVHFTTEERDSLVRMLMQSERICSSSEELLELATVIGFLSQKHGLPMHAPKTWRQVVSQLDRMIAAEMPGWPRAERLKHMIDHTVREKEAEESALRRI